jgi:hypothetical protein
MKYIGEIRPLGLCLLLSIVSLGVFNIYWAYTVSYEVREAVDESRLNPKVELVGCIFTLGVYLVYWLYKYEKYIVKISREQGLVVKDYGLVMSILSMFFLFPISMMIMQRQLNNLWEIA